MFSNPCLLESFIWLETWCEYIDIGIYGLQDVLLKCETIVMILSHVVSFSRVSYALKQSAQGNIPSVNVYICIQMTSRYVIDS